MIITDKFMCKQNFYVVARQGMFIPQFVLLI